MDPNAVSTVIVQSLRRSNFPGLYKVFHIDCYTLYQYLPLLPSAQRIDAHRLVSSSEWDQPMQTAFLWLFTHLSEVSQTGTSGALLQNLESSYKHPRRRSNRLIHSHGRDPRARHHTVSIFDRLAYLLRRYGYHPDLFVHMSTFFTRHCDTMIQRRPYDALMCLRGLRAIGGDIDSVLACLSCHSRSAGKLLRLADSVEAWQQSEILPDDVRGDLAQLVVQKAGRMRGRVLGGGGGGGMIRVGGGKRRPGTVLRGDELDIEDLEAVWERAAHRIRVDMTGREDMLGGGGYNDWGGYEDWDDYNDRSDEGYDEEYYSSESDDPFYDLTARRAQPAHARSRARRRLEGRGGAQRSLGWPGEGLHWGGYGQGERVGGGGSERSEL
ncbi:hypothetical protein MMC15_002201 [Xylographa vitiligo]|nr:hypothetical protein [Xylographa vitiligo]